MPNPRHRIDLVVVPEDPGRPIPEVSAQTLCQLWEQDGLLQGDRPGAASSALIEGGFARLWMDRPSRMVLYANQQGGFRVTCPVTGASIAPEFGAALVRWRAGEERRLRCPSCAEHHALESCELSPPGAFGSSALVFSDVEGVDLSERARADLHRAIGDFRVVLRRTI